MNNTGTLQALLFVVVVIGILVISVYHALLRDTQRKVREAIARAERAEGLAAGDAPPAPATPNEDDTLIVDMLDNGKAGYSLDRVVRIDSYGEPCMANDTVLTYNGVRVQRPTLREAFAVIKAATPISTDLKRLNP